MAWTDNVFSTQNTIARHEAEINELAGTYSRKAIKQAADTILAPVPDDLAAITAVKSDNSTVALTYDAVNKQFTLDKNLTITRLLIDNDYFSVLEGTGNNLYSASGDYTLTAGTSLVWVDIDLQNNWDNKIDLAKEMIGNRLTVMINQRWLNYNLDLDDIENPEVLNLASDYKVLELIYLDMLGKNGSDRFEKKMLDYRERYEKEMANALAMLDFGNTTIPFRFTEGIIAR